MVSMFAQIHGAWGRLDVQVNNAGVSRLPGDGFDEMMAGEGSQITLMGYAAFSKMMAIHPGGTFLCTREAVKLMGEGGSVITVSSIAGLSGWGPVHYSSAKGAVLGFTRAASKELGGMGIRINAIAPGVIDTPMTADVDEAMLAPLVTMTPLGRQGTAGERSPTRPCFWPPRRVRSSPASGSRPTGASSPSDRKPPGLPARWVVSQDQVRRVRSRSSRCRSVSSASGPISAIPAARTSR
ncbi:MAG: hypothetical protein CM1200mP26_00890 [Acidimicrobiales bacterium]|nr:MAG: hypothetical protein CM1200mP26_00890 [Acidimicrobiales bacterium]